MKTDQIVAHGHAVIKQPLAYTGKSKPSSSRSYSHHWCSPTHFSHFFCHVYKTHLFYSLFISPVLITICVVAVAGLTGSVTGIKKELHGGNMHGGGLKGHRGKQSNDHDWAEAAAVSTAALNLISPKRTAILNAFGCLFLACYHSDHSSRAQNEDSCWRQHGGTSASLIKKCVCLIYKLK